MGVHHTSVWRMVATISRFLHPQSPVYSRAAGSCLLQFLYVASPHPPGASEVGERIGYGSRALFLKPQEGQSAGSQKSGVISRSVVLGQLLLPCGLYFPLSKTSPKYSSSCQALGWVLYLALHLAHSRPSIKIGCGEQ